MEKFEIKHLMDEWQYVPNGFLYVLHKRQGENLECNKLYGRIYPDYAGGITEEDANRVAAMFKASPLLLSALIKAVQQVDERFITDWYHEAKAAIAAAGVTITQVDDTNVADLKTTQP